jgi:hypothetical protein
MPLPEPELYSRLRFGAIPLVPGGSFISTECDRKPLRSTSAAVRNTGINNMKRKREREREREPFLIC